MIVPKWNGNRPADEQCEDMKSYIDDLTNEARDPMRHYVEAIRILVEERDAALDERAQLLAALRPFTASRKHPTAQCDWTEADRVFRKFAVEGRDATKGGE